MTAAPDLGPRQLAVLERLAAHPGLTATELARAFGIAEPYKQLAALQQKGLVVGAPVWHQEQGRNVVHWDVAPPGSTPPPCPAPDPAELRRRRERDTAASVPAGPACTRRAGRPALPRQRLPARHARART